MIHRILAAPELRALRTGSSALAAGIGCVLLCVCRPGVVRRWRNACNAGGAAVEFAITAPVLVALVIGGADYSIMANKQDALAAATRAGAEYARANPGDGPNWTNTKGFVAAGYTASTGYTTFSPAATVNASTVSTCVDGTNGPAATPIVCNAHQPADPRVLKYVSITATQNFSALLAWAAFGFPATLSATTVARFQ
jgi:Flp pilus assembly protein TadG